MATSKIFFSELNDEGGTDIRFAPGGQGSRTSLVAFITKDGAFYLDSENQQVQMSADEFDEMGKFIIRVRRDLGLIR